LALQFLALMMFTLVSKLSKHKKSWFIASKIGPH
jgi:hypothetical protein